MKNQIDNLLNFTLLNIDDESSQRIKKNSLPLLECYIKKTSSTTYTIIDKIKKMDPGIRLNLSIGVCVIENNYGDIMGPIDNSNIAIMKGLI